MLGKPAQTELERGVRLAEPIEVPAVEGDLLAAYRTVGGRDVDPIELRYWEAMGTLKWGVICEIQAFTHLQGTVRSVELATLGRRVAEMEWDLLELIDRSGDR